MRNIVIFAAIGLLSSSASYAQDAWSGVILDTPIGYQTSPFEGQAVSPLNPDVVVGGCDLSGVTCAFSGINVQNFASQNEVDAVSTRLEGGLTTLSHQLDSKIGALSTWAIQATNEAKEMAVIAAAMKDAIPNPGDRFAVRLNMAGAAGRVAGSASFSMNVNRSVRFSVGYGRSENQGMFNGGVNFSFN